MDTEEGNKLGKWLCRKTQEIKILSSSKYAIAWMRNRVRN